MPSSEPDLLTVDLKKEAKCCASCIHCSADTLHLEPESVAVLKTSCLEILQKLPSETPWYGANVSLTDLLPLLALVKQIGERKVFCRRERTRVGFWEVSCFAWQQRT